MGIKNKLWYTLHYYFLPSWFTADNARALIDGNNNMGLLKNIATRMARKATMSEFERLKNAIQQFPEKSIGDIFQVTANLAPALSQSFQILTM